MSPADLHLIYQLAGVAAGVATWFLVRMRFASVLALTDTEPYSILTYFSLLAGAVFGVYWFGPSYRWQWDWITGTHALYGAIISALLAREIYRQFAGVRVSPGALYMLPLFIAGGIGRMGCYFNAQKEGLLGIECYWPWCLRRGDFVPHHQMALYEVVTFWLLAFVSFVWLEQWPRSYMRWGYAFGIIVASLVHFYVVFLRGHPDGVEFAFFGVRAVQWEMLALALYALLSLDRRHPGTGTGANV